MENVTIVLIEDIEANEYELELYLVKKRGSNEKIGFLTIERNKPHFVVQSYLKERFQKKGLGKMMYSEAIERLGCLSTRYNDASTKAQRVWRSLDNVYTGSKDFWTGEMTLRKRKKRTKKSS